MISFPLIKTFSFLAWKKKEGIGLILSPPLKDVALVLLVSPTFNNCIDIFGRDMQRDRD